MKYICGPRGHLHLNGYPLSNVQMLYAKLTENPKISWQMSQYPVHLELGNVQLEQHNSLSFPCISAKLPVFSLTGIFLFAILPVLPVQWGSCKWPHKTEVVNAKI